MLQTNLWWVIPNTCHANGGSVQSRDLAGLEAALDVPSSIWVHPEIAIKVQQHTTVKTPVAGRAVLPQSSSQGGPLLLIT